MLRVAVFSSVLAATTFGQGLPIVPEGVVDCGNYDGSECTGEGPGCVGEGWFSKVNRVEPNLRVNAARICLDMGFDGWSDEEYGGNWGKLCRYPGEVIGSANKVGGSITQLGYTVSWKCTGSRDGSTDPPTSPPSVNPTGNPTEYPTGNPTENPTALPTPPPTSAPSVPATLVPTPNDGPSLPDPVVDCGKYDGAECTGEGPGCVGEGWFSKTNSLEPNLRVNALQICLDMGFEGADTEENGGNWRKQCRYPGNVIGQANKVGGELTEFGFTVSWKCTGSRNSPTEPSTQLPTPAPTNLPTSVPALPQCSLLSAEECEKASGEVMGISYGCKFDKRKDLCVRNPKCKKAHKANAKNKDPASCEADPNCDVKISMNGEGEIKKVKCRDNYAKNDPLQNDLEQ